MLKKLLFVMAAAVAAASCVNENQGYSANYTLGVTFEYGAGVFQSDSLYMDKQLGVGIAWENMGFHHKLNDDKSEFQGGFVISRLKGGGTSEQDRFRVNSGVGRSGSYTYAVYYANPDESKMPEKDIEFLEPNYGTCTMVGCYMNNTKEVVNAVKANFVEGDRLAVRMTGYLGGEKTGEAEFVLAEYTAEKDSLVTGWSPFTLDKLGSVETIDIEIISSRDDIPTAFCMDDMITQVSVTYN